VIRIHDPNAELPTEALMLIKALSLSGSSSGKRILQIVVKGASFSSASPAFVVEVSHPEKPIRNAFAFTESAQDGLRPFTIVPVQRDAGRFRAILSEQPIGQRFCFVLEFEVDANAVEFRHSHVPESKRRNGQSLCSKFSLVHMIPVPMYKGRFNFNHKIRRARAIG
jgi:hypothetical protein